MYRASSAYCAAFCAAHRPRGKRCDGSQRHLRWSCHRHCRVSCSWASRSDRCQASVRWISGNRRKRGDSPRSRSPDHAISRIEPPQRALPLRQAAAGTPARSRSPSSARRGRSTTRGSRIGAHSIDSRPRTAGQGRRPRPIWTTMPIAELTKAIRHQLFLQCTVSRDNVAQASCRVHLARQRCRQWWMLGRRQLNEL